MTLRQCHLGGAGSVAVPAGGGGSTRGLFLAWSSRLAIPLRSVGALLLAPSLGFEQTWESGSLGFCLRKRLFIDRSAPASSKADAGCR